MDPYTLLCIVLTHFLVFALKYVRILSVYVLLITSAASHLSWHFFARHNSYAYLQIVSIFLLVIISCIISYYYYYLLL